MIERASIVSLFSLYKTKLTKSPPLNITLKRVQDHLSFGQSSLELNVARRPRLADLPPFEKNATTLPDTSKF